MTTTAIYEIKSILEIIAIAILYFISLRTRSMVMFLRREIDEESGARESSLKCLEMARHRNAAMALPVKSVKRAEGVACRNKAIK